MNVQTDLLKEIGKIREEFRNVTYAINEDKENMNRINQQVKNILIIILRCKK